MARTENDEYILDFCDDSDVANLPVQSEIQNNVVVGRDSPTQEGPATWLTDHCYVPDPNAQPVFLNLQLADIIIHSLTSGNYKSFVEKWKIKVDQKMRVAIRLPYTLEVKTHEWLVIFLFLGDPAGGERLQIGDMPIVFNKPERNGETEFLNFWCQSQADRDALWSILAHVLLRTCQAQYLKVKLRLGRVELLLPFLGVTRIDQLDIVWNREQQGMSAEHFHTITQDLSVTVFRFSCPAHREAFHGVFRNEFLILLHASWLTKENVLSMECCLFEARNTRFGPSDLRDVVMGWMRGRMKNLIVIRLVFEEQQEGYELEVVRDLRYVDWHPPYCKVRIFDGTDSKDFLIRRCDGQLITLQFFPRFFSMIVHETPSCEVESSHFTVDMLRN